MPLVRVRIDLKREIALDWFVLQTQLQDQTFWSVLRTARIFHEEKIGNSKNKGVDEQLSGSLLCHWRARRYAYGS